MNQRSSPQFISDTPSNLKNRRSPLSFKTLRGRIFLFIAVCIATLLIFTVTIYIQNQRTLDATQKVKNLRVPIPILISDIVSGANSAAAAQRAYLMTNDIQFKKERLRIWKEIVNPSMNQLLLLKEEINSDSLKVRLEAAQELVANYEKIQQQIDEFFENYYDDLSDFSLTEDSTYATLKERIKNKTYLANELYNKVRDEATTARVRIKTLLNPLLENQKKLLNSEIQGIEEGIDITRITILLTATLVFLFAFSFSYITLGRLKESVNKPQKLLTKLANGELPKEVQSTNDEMAEVIEAGNRLSQNLKIASQFAQNIGEGQFDSNFNPVGHKDVLGNSLIQMRDRLKQVAEEDKKRSWVTQGLAKFAEIIRANDDDFDTLGDVVLASLIEYVGANQGGLYIARDSEGSREGHTVLDMIACYAYNRKKYQTKQIKVFPDYAETLLGQVFLEQEKIYMTDIPENYINITSGLGDVPPSNLLLVPIKGNEEVEGVLEVAAFTQFDAFQIEFIEKICESIASAVRSIKVNEHTHKLVKELQEQTEAMRAQEEEMRQNMEELTSTQEQMRKKQNELESLKVSLETEVQRRTRELQDSLTRFNLINQSSSEGLWDMLVPKDGQIDHDTEIFWSKNLISSLGFQPEEFPNKLDSWLSRLHPEDKEKTFQEFINHLQDRSNQTPFSSEHRLKTKKEGYRWFKASCRTLRDTQGKPLRVAGYINDITHEKELSHAMHELRMQKAELERKQNELQSANDKMRSNEMVLKKAFEKMKRKENELKDKNRLLSTNELRFKNIVKNTPGVIFQMTINAQTKEAHFTFISDYVQQILGYSSEELENLEHEQFQAVVHYDDQPSYKEKYNKALEELSTFNWEGKVRHKDKSWRWMQVNASLHQEGKSAIQLDGIFLDMTELKDQEKQLKSLNEELQANEEELRQNLEELQATQDKMSVKQEELSRLNQKMQSNEKILLKSFDKIRAKEKELNLRNQELSVIVNASHKAVVMTNNERSIIIVNRATERIFGYPQEELIGKKIDELFSPKSLSQTISLWNSNGNPQDELAYKAELQSLGQRKDGSIFPIYISMRIENVANQDFGVAFIEDLSEQKGIPTQNLN